jgi:hypothetical protein
MQATESMLKSSMATSVSPASHRSNASEASNTSTKSFLKNKAAMLSAAKKKVNAENPVVQGTAKVAVALDKTKSKFGTTEKELVAWIEGVQVQAWLPHIVMNIRDPELACTVVK